MKKIEKPDQTKYLLMALLFIIGGLVLYYIYWQVVPIELYYDVEQPYNVLNEEIRAGDAVDVNQVYCKNGSEYVDVSVFLRNEDESFSRTVYVAGSARGRGCHDVVSSSAIIPMGILSGEYKLVYIIHADINAVRDETVTLETELFEVIE